MAISPGQILTGPLFSEPMRVVMEYETGQGGQVEDVHEKNGGYDVTSLDLQSGELRLSKSRVWPPPAAASC